MSISEVQTDILDEAVVKIGTDLEVEIKAKALIIVVEDIIKRSTTTEDITSTVEAVAGTVQGERKDVIEEIDLETKRETDQEIRKEIGREIDQGTKKETDPGTEIVVIAGEKRNITEVDDHIVMMLKTDATIIVKRKEVMRRTRGNKLLKKVARNYQRNLPFGKKEL